MARQFFRGNAENLGTTVEFLIPVRKITISAIANDLMLSVGTKEWGAQSFKVPKNTSVKIDFQSENCGKGVQHLIFWSSGQTLAEYSVSVDEYANVGAGDDLYFNRGVTSNE